MEKIVLGLMSFLILIGFSGCEGKLTLEEAREKINDIRQECQKEAMELSEEGSMKDLAKLRLQCKRDIEDIKMRTDEEEIRESVNLFMGGIIKEALSEQIENSEENQLSDKSIEKNEKILPELGILYPLDKVIVKLKGDTGRRYLKTDISLEFTDENVKKELDSKKEIIRDEIIKVLSSKVLEQISARKAKKKLSLEIIDVLNSKLEKGEIVGLYFTEFLVL